MSKKKHMFSRDVPFKSASSFIINLFGGIVYIVATAGGLYFYPEVGAFNLCIIVLPIAITFIVLCELIFLKVHRRPRVGLIAPKNAPDDRVKVKFFGFYASMGLLSVFYSVLPAYEDDFYSAWFMFSYLLLAVFSMGALIYIPEVDRRLRDPYDGYWHFGNLVLGRWGKFDKAVIGSHLKSLFLRAYFMPVMVIYLLSSTLHFVDGPDQQLLSHFSVVGESWGLWFLKIALVGYFFLAAMDVFFAVIGYLMVFKVLDSDIRSTEPTFLGWFVCIVCYFPFWEVTVITVFLDGLYNGRVWYEWFGHMPYVVVFWGGAVILSRCLESLVTLNFGIRFSNLTYRGLVSDGFFRFTKHPQYFFKLLTRFFVLVPFLSVSGVFGVFETMLMFCGLCFVYYLRAKTEENHLSRYPEYVEYANWINEHGMFRFVGRIFPSLVFSEKNAKAGNLF